MIAIKNFNRFKRFAVVFLCFFTIQANAQSKKYSASACINKGIGRMSDCISLKIIGKPGEYQGDYSIIEKVTYISDEREYITHPYSVKNETDRYYVIVSGKKYYFSF